MSDTAQLVKKKTKKEKNRKPLFVYEYEQMTIIRDSPTEIIHTPNGKIIKKCEVEDFDFVWHVEDLINWFVKEAGKKNVEIDITGLNALKERLAKRKYFAEKKK